MLYWHRRGRGSAAGRAAVVGDEVRVRHHKLDSIRRNAQLLRRGLRKLRPRALADFDLAGHDGDGAVLGDVDAGRNAGAGPGITA